MEQIWAFISGGALVALITFLGRSSIEARRLYLEKLEDISEQAENYYESLQSYFSTWRTIASLGYEKSFFELSKQNEKEIPNGYRRIKILIRVYAPELQECLDEIYKYVGDAGNKIYITYDYRFDGPFEKNEELSQFLVSEFPMELTSVFKKFNEKVSAEARKGFVRFIPRL